jgi:hypothetical protein
MDSSATTSSDLLLPEHDARSAITPHAIRNDPKDVIFIPHVSGPAHRVPESLIATNQRLA